MTEFFIANKAGPRPGFVIFYPYDITARLKPALRLRGISDMLVT